MHKVVNETALLEYSNGVFVRLKLPKLHTSTLIGRCLTTLEYAIPSKDACQVLFSQWYCVRNSPGPSSISNAQEWNMFSKCLMQLLGYQTDLINFSVEEFSVTSSDTSMSSPCSSKKMRKSDDGCDGDWQKLLTSQRHHESGKQLSFVLGLEDIVPDPSAPGNRETKNETSQINCNAPLFGYLSNILQALHMLYEDSKLNKFHWKGCPLLASLLSRIAADLEMEQYVQHYWRDFPSVCHMECSNAKTNQIPPSLVVKLSSNAKHSLQPFNIFKTLLNLLKNEKITPVSAIPNVTSRTQELVVIFALSVAEDDKAILEKLVAPSEDLKSLIESSRTQASSAARIVDYLVHCGYNGWTVTSIPIGFAIPILSALYQCRLSPPPMTWHTRAYDLIGRPELRPNDDPSEREEIIKVDNKNLLSGQPIDGASGELIEDGLEDVEGELTDLRWPHDRRVAEVRKFLQSARPVIIGVQQRPEVSDHDFVEEQERSLQSLCVRTMALPVGRGAMGYQTAAPLPTGVYLTFNPKSVLIRTCSFQNPSRFRAYV